MSNDYWLGLATLPALALVLWTALGATQWWRWWFVHTRPGFHGGKGYVHVADFYDREDARWWLRGEHTHEWPPDTPWWLIRLAEPVRIWLCHHSDDHRPATAETDTESETQA